MLLPLHLSLYFGLNVRIRLCTAVEILLDARTLNSRVSIQAEVAEPMRGERSAGQESVSCAASSTAKVCRPLRCSTVPGLQKAKAAASSQQLLRPRRTLVPDVAYCWRPGSRPLPWQHYESSGYVGKGSFPALRSRHRTRPAARTCFSSPPQG
eukprot:scaffold10484_cov31-Tisochrysis_lutea.AAC.2